MKATSFDLHASWAFPGKSKKKSKNREICKPHTHTHKDFQKEGEKRNPWPPPSFNHLFACSMSWSASGCRFQSIARLPSSFPSTRTLTSVFSSSSPSQTTPCTTEIPRSSCAGSNWSSLCPRSGSPGRRCRRRCCLRARCHALWPRRMRRLWMLSRGPLLCLHPLRRSDCRPLRRHTTSSNSRGR